MPTTGIQPAEMWYRIPSQNGPAHDIHALVIGVSRYDHLPDEGDLDLDGTFGLGQVKTPASSAFRFARWLREDMRHPKAQVATIRLLLSASDEELAANEHLGDAVAVVPRPTRSNVMRALTDWRDECLSRIDDVAVLYVGGHGLQLGDRGGGFVMLQDFAYKYARRFENVLDVGATRLAMSREDAPQLQVYFIDACRVEPVRFKDYMKHPPAASLDTDGHMSFAKNSAVYFAAAPGTAAYGDREKGTIFTQALMECLRGRAAHESQDGRIVTVSSLQRGLRDLVPILAKELNIELMQEPMLGGEYQDPDAVLHVSVPAQSAGAERDDGATAEAVSHRRIYDSETHGALCVTVRSLPVTPEGLELSVPVDVIDVQDRALRRCATGDVFQLDPGSYQIVVALPDGTRPTIPQEIAAGQRVDLELGWHPARFGAVTASATAWSGAKSANGDAPRAFALRFLRYADKGTDLDDEAPSATVADCEYDEGVLRVSMRITLNDTRRGLRFAQLAVAGRSFVDVALPLAPASDATDCHLDVAVSARHVVPAASLGGSPEAETVAHFVLGGMQDRIAATPSLARNMLIGARTHPIGAALAGYGLLSTRTSDDLQVWPGELAHWYPWLPDGAIVAGEQAQREGDLDGALQRFCEAVRRGPPVFTEGLSILTSRLREHVWTRRTQEAAASAAVALETVVDWAACADLTALTLTIRRGDVASFDSTGQLMASATSEGWRIFTMPVGDVDGPEDYWIDGD